jgi:hypothetical protein
MALRFYGGRDHPYRIFTALRPFPLVDMPYLFYMWKSKNNNLETWQRRFKGRRKPSKNQRGGWFGRLRVGPLQPMRRVIEPAVRYERVTRQCNEIRVRRARQQKFFYPWDVRRPKCR